MVAIAWKKRVFLSPSLIHFDRDCCAQNISFLFSHCHRWTWCSFRSVSSASVNILSLAMESRLWIFSSSSAIWVSILPKTFVFHVLRLDLTCLSFSVRVIPLDWDHVSFIFSIQPGCVSQLSMNLNRRGPQSLSRVDISSGQWSDKLRFNSVTLMHGYRSIHSGDTNSRSSLLFDWPRNHVKVSFEGGISSTCISCKKLLKSFEPLDDIRWLPLSFGWRTSLKSPDSKHGSPEDFQKSRILRQTRSLSFTLQGQYTFMRVQWKFEDGITPEMAIQCWSWVVEVIVKNDLFHMEIIPPELPIEGLAAHWAFGSFHIVLTNFWLSDSNFVSWMHMNWGSCLLINFRIEPRLILAPRPRIFQDSSIIISGDWWEGGFGFITALLPNLTFVGRFYSVGLRLIRRTGCRSVLLLQLYLWQWLVREGG